MESKNIHSGREAKRNEEEADRGCGRGWVHLTALETTFGLLRGAERKAIPYKALTVYSPKLIS